MRLYHTGREIIKIPDITIGRKNADFGQGFYLSDDLEFSRRWVRERIPYVNIYELDENDLVIHRFSRDINWFSCIFRNRRGLVYEIAADVIIGPIANDTIYDTFGIITSGLLKDEDIKAVVHAIGKLQVGEPTDMGVDDFTDMKKCLYSIRLSESK